MTDPVLRHRRRPAVQAREDRRGGNPERGA
jgi:hypothetical protein